MGRQILVHVTIQEGRVCYSDMVQNTHGGSTQISSSKSKETKKMKEIAQLGLLSKFYTPKNK